MNPNGPFILCATDFSVHAAGVATAAGKLALRRSENLRLVYEIDVCSIGAQNTMRKRLEAEACRLRQAKTKVEAVLLEGLRPVKALLDYIQSARPVLVGCLSTSGNPASAGRSAAWRRPSPSPRRCRPWRCAIRPRLMRGIGRSSGLRSCSRSTATQHPTWCCGGTRCFAWAGRATWSPITSNGGCCGAKTMRLVAASWSIRRRGKFTLSSISARRSATRSRTTRARSWCARISGSLRPVSSGSRAN